MAKPGPVGLQTGLLRRAKSRTTMPTKPSQTLGRARGARTPRIHRLRRKSHRGRANSARRTATAHRRHHQHHSRPEGALGPDAYDDPAPATYPRNAIEQAIDDAITNPPTPSTLPGTPLDRL